ncbi:MAG: NAD(P)-binding domain-containing protein [Planctomycetes bacterium]|nr:NAD(P)-binding domain-containing protein [Planctomycetota bacterium]
MNRHDDTSSKYCVIGAGAAGLTVCRALRQHGIPFDCYEREHDVGGIFLYGQPNSSLYQSTHLLSSKSTTEYPDFPMPADYPPCPHHSLVLEYFRSYARHFQLYDQIRFQTGVEQLIPSSTGWSVRLAGERARSYRGVVIANGHYWDPVWPDFRGKFSGTLLHSKQYKTPDVLLGKRVLVIGAGNSACDIAAEAVSVAKRVVLSIRRPVHFLPKLSFGKTGDATAQQLIRWGMPLWMLRILSELGARVINGRPQDLGMGVPDHRIFESSVTVSTLVPYHVRHGDITIKPGVDELEGSSVRFADGSTEPFDVIVCATGFRVSFPFIDHRELNGPAGSPRLYLHQFHPHRNDLSVVGLFQSATGGHWGLMHYQAQLLARLLAAQAAGANLDWFDRLRNQTAPDLKGGFATHDSERHQYIVEPVRFERHLTRLIGEFDRRYGQPAVTSAPSAPLAAQRNAA